MSVNIEEFCCETVNLDGAVKIHRTINELSEHEKHTPKINIKKKIN